MQMKVSPIVNSRYWTAILIASTCGTNLGDIIPHVLGLDVKAGFLLTAAFFAVAVLSERLTRRGTEAFYWMAILIVRAAATEVADSLIGKAHFNYVEAFIMLLIPLVFLVTLQQWLAARREWGGIPSVDTFYWLTMLAAGSLGTVAGDGFGHAIGSPYIGFPISALTASLALVIIFCLRARMNWTNAWSYWAAVVTVRWWGSNMGDIAAYFLSLVSSALITFFALISVLLIWKAQRRRGDTIEEESEVVA